MIRRALCVACLCWLLPAGVATAQINAVSPAVLDPEQRALTAAEQAVIDYAIESWERKHPGVGPITIEFSFDSGIGSLAVANDFTSNQLGEPAFSTVRFRDEEPSLYWIDPAPGFSPPEAVPFGFFDLYTIALHEIGHAIGFTRFYSKFDAHIGPEGGEFNHRPFDCAGPPQIEATLLSQSQGTHTAFMPHPQDLMNAGIAGARRKVITPLNALMLDCAFDYGITERVPSLSPWAVAALILSLLAAMAATAVKS